MKCTCRTTWHVWLHLVCQEGAQPPVELMVWTGQHTFASIGSSAEEKARPTTWSWWWDHNVRHNLTAPAPSSQCCFLHSSLLTTLSSLVFLRHNMRMRANSSEWAYTHRYSDGLLKDCNTHVGTDWKSSWIGAVSFQSRRLYESKSNEKWIMSVCVNQACVAGQSSCGWFKAKTDLWISFTKKLGRLKCQYLFYRWNNEV